MTTRLKPSTGLYQRFDRYLKSLANCLKDVYLTSVQKSTVNFVLHINTFMLLCLFGCIRRLSRLKSFRKAEHLLCSCEDLPSVRMVIKL